MGSFVPLSPETLSRMGDVTIDESRWVPLAEPSAGESFSAAIQQAGLGTIGQLAAIPRIVGDLFNAPSLSQWGRDLNLNAKQAAEELTPLGEGSMQAILREATVNTAQSIPALVSGGLVPALTIMGGQSYLDGYSQARDGGLSVGRSHIFAGIDAIFETATEAWSLPVLFKANLPVLRRANEFLMKELVGEEITTIGQSMNAWLQLNPQVTLGEYAQQLKQEMLHTALVTPPTALMQMGVAGGAKMLRRTSKGLPLQVEGDMPDPTGGPSTPVPGQPTIAVPQPGVGQLPLPGVTPPTKQDYQNYTPSPVEMPDIGKLVQDNQITDPRQMPLPLETPAPGPAPVTVPENVMKTPEQSPLPPVEQAPIVVKKETADVLENVVVPEMGPQMPADLAPIVPMAPAPEEVAPADYREHTPEALAAMKQPDLRLYQGIFSPARGLTMVAWDKNVVDPVTGDAGAWRVGYLQIGNKMPIEDTLNSPAYSQASSVFNTYEEAKEFLVKGTGMELTPENIKAQHKLLTFRDAVSMDGRVTPKQLEIYGETLGRIADKAKLFRDTQGFKSSVSPTGAWKTSLRGPDLPIQPNRNPRIVLPDGTKTTLEQGPADGVFLLEDVQAPTTDLANAQAQILRLVTIWKTRYKIKGRIVIELSSSVPAENGSVGIVSTGNIDHQKPLDFHIRLSTKGTTQGRIMAAAHEFGHILGFETIHYDHQDALLELTEQWLDTMNTLSKDPTALELANTAGGVFRALIRSPSVMPGSVGSDVKYSMSFHEFIADQTAQHLYEHKYYDPRSSTVKKALTDIAGALQNYFQTAIQKFAPKLTFKKFLDGMAKVTPETPKVAKPSKTVVEKVTKKKTAGGATVKITPAKVAPADPLKKFDPELVKERVWLVGLMKQHGMWDTVTREEIDPNGSVEGFDFEKAKELLDAVGVNWEGGADLGSSPKGYASLQFSVGDIVLMDSPSQAMAKRYPAAGKIIAISGETVTIQGDDGKIVTRDARKVRDAVSFMREHSREGRPQYRPHQHLVDFPLDEGSSPRMVDEPDTWQFRNALATAIPKLAGNDMGLRNKLADSALSIRNFGRLWRSTLTALQIRKIYGGSIPGVKRFVDGLQAMSAYASKVRKRAEDGLELMRQTGEKQRGKVFELMIKETEQGKFLNTPEEFMKAGLGEDGIKLYHVLRADYNYALEVMENLAHKSLLESFAVRVVGNQAVNASDGMPLSEEKAKNLAAEQKKISEAFAKMRAKPYYPHTRFGDYYAVAKMEDGKTIAFTQAESLNDVRRYAEAIAGEGVTSWYGEMPEEVKPFMNMPYQVFEMMKSQLNLTPKQLSEFEDILKNLAPEQSFIRKFKQRRNIEGWENNPDQGPQVYAHYFSKFANYAARRHHSAGLDDAIKETRQFKKEIFGEETATNVVLIDRLTNWMAETKEYAMRPDIAAANIRAAVTLWYLGAVPKSAVINAASVPLMTLPWLGKRYGDLKAAAALKQAYMDIGKMFKRAESLSPDERKLLDYLEEIGVADQSYASTMAAVTEGGKLMEATMLGKGSLKAHAYNLKWFAMWGFHKVEVMNRLVTGMAAYRLAKQQMGHTGEELNMTAAEIAKDAIQDTQNENLQWNRPELMRGKKSLLTLFMSYTQNAMFQMYGGDQSWQRMLALQLMIAGLLGLPLAKNMNDLIEWFSKEVFGTKASAETALRDFLKGTVVNPDWVLKGASYNFLNTGVNLQGSLSMGNLIPGIDALVLEGTFPERLANAASDVGGAGAAVMISFMQAMADNNPDSMKAWSRAMPTAIKNSYEGYKMITQGTITDAGNDTIARVSGAEGTAKVLGFQSTNVSRSREVLFQQKQMVQYWMTRRKMVFDLYELAEKTGDISTELEAEKAVEQFNDDVPDAALSIRKKDLQNAMRRRRENAEKKEAGEPTSKRNTGLYEEVAGRYSAG